MTRSKKAIINFILVALMGVVAVVWAGGRSESDKTKEVDGPYRDYSEDAFLEAAEMKRVLFFHASWCPNCRRAEKDIKQNLAEIPEDVVIFKTDYDSERTLKRKYGITYQHTFVYVDDEGEAITKWSGGGAEDIIDRVEG